MVGQKFVINVDQSVQVSTARSAVSLGVTARLLPLPGETLLWTYLCGFLFHTVVTQVLFARMKVFFWSEEFVFLGLFYTMFATHCLSRHFWVQHEHRVCVENVS